MERAHGDLPRVRGPGRLAQRLALQHRLRPRLAALAVRGGRAPGDRFGRPSAGADPCAGGLPVRCGVRLAALRLRRRRGRRERGQAALDRLPAPGESGRQRAGAEQPQRLLRKGGPDAGPSQSASTLPRTTAGSRATLPARARSTRRAGLSWLPASSSISATASRPCSGAPDATRQRTRKRVASAKSGCPPGIAASAGSERRARPRAQRPRAPSRAGRRARWRRARARGLAARPVRRGCAARPPAPRRLPGAAPGRAVPGQRGVPLSAPRRRARGRGGAPPDRGSRWRRRGRAGGSRARRAHAPGRAVGVRRDRGCEAAPKHDVLEGRRPRPRPARSLGERIWR